MLWMLTFKGKNGGCMPHLLEVIKLKQNRSFFDLSWVAALVASTWPETSYSTFFPVQRGHWYLVFAQWHQYLGGWSSVQVQMKRTAQKACLLLSKAEANSGWLSDPSIDPDMKWKYFVRVTRTATPMRRRRTPRMMRTITQAGLNTIILEMNKSQDNLHWFHDFKMVNLFPVFVLNTHLVPAKHNHKLS